MKHKNHIFGLVLLYGMLFIFTIAYVTKQQTAEAKSRSQVEIMNIADFQRYLNELEPDNPIAVDGRLGPATQAKWERVYCNHCAEKTF